jgi:hypothetical protein
MSVLKKAWVKKRTSSLLSNHVGALDFVMRQHCRSWPHGVDAGFPGRDQGHVASLVGWVARASAAAARMSHGEIWWSGGDAIRWDVSLEQAFGQLRALEAMPEEIEPLFAKAGGQKTSSITSDRAILASPKSFTSTYASMPLRPIRLRLSPV